MNDEWEHINSELIEHVDITDLANTYTNSRNCPICGSINGWGRQIPSTMFIHCKRCGIKYDATHITYQEYIDGFEPPMAYRNLVEKYMENIKERTDIINKFKELMYVRSDILVIGSSIGIYNDIYGSRYNILGIEASCRKIDISHDIYDNINVLYMLAEDIRFYNRFNTVIINNMLNETDYPIKVLCNAWSALKNGGRLYIIHNDENMSGRLLLSNDDVIRLSSIATGRHNVGSINNVSKYHIIEYMKNE